MFLKKKSDRTIKGRACAISTPQCAYIKTEGATSPTCATESVFITSVVNAQKRHHVASFDVPTSFLYAFTDKDVVMRLEGRLAQLMVKLDPSMYRKYITTTSKGKPIL